MDELRETVRERYAAAATSVKRGLAADDVTDAACCEPANGYGLKFYDVTERGALPDEAVLASLGCGNPTAVADLAEGETVLDLGSGGGIDVLLSARRVGPDRIGLRPRHDRRDARARARERPKAEATNVEFLKGFIEDVPLPDASVDIVISNCVINLSTDKPRVIREMFRVLRPGGRIGISDVVAANDLSPAERAERGSYVGCIAGALSIAEYEHELKAAGFEQISIGPTHAEADQMYGAIVRATKPAS